MEIKIRFTGLSPKIFILYSLLFFGLVVLLFGLKAKDYVAVIVVESILVLIGLLVLRSKSLMVPNSVTFAPDELRVTFLTSWDMKEREIVFKIGSWIQIVKRGIPKSIQELYFKAPNFSMLGDVDSNFSSRIFLSEDT